MQSEDESNELGRHVVQLRMLVGFGSHTYVPLVTLSLKVFRPIMQGMSLLGCNLSWCYVQKRFENVQ